MLFFTGEIESNLTATFKHSISNDGAIAFDNTQANAALLTADSIRNSRSYGVVHMKSSRIFSKNVLPVFCALIFVCFIIFIFLFLLVGSERFLVKMEINNPYVNNHFWGWKRVSIDNFDAFSIPGNWSLSEEDNMYRVTDASNQVWAYGAIIGAEYNFSNYDEFLMHCFPVNSVSIELEPFERFIMMNGSDIDKLIVSTNEKSESFYILQMFVDMETEIVWIIAPDLSEEPDQYAIAEAVVYSYAF